MTRFHTSLNRLDVFGQTISLMFIDELAAVATTSRFTHAAKQYLHHNGSRRPLNALS
jgi:hypothetical protein